MNINRSFPKLAVLLAITTTACITSNPAAAAIINVNITANWTPNNFTVIDAGDPMYNPANPAVDGAVFGVTPSVGSTTINLQVDTASYMAYSAGYSFNVGGTTYTLSHDWYGYTNVTLVGGTHTFGTATWNDAGILTDLIGVDGNVAALWTDANIESTDPTRASFRMFGTGDGLTADIFVGSRTYETIGNQFLLWEYYAGEEIRVDNYSISTSVVPVPAAVWLFGSGLAGLIGISRRKHPSTKSA